MHFSWNSAKALFFIVNHVAATHVPRDLVHPKLSGRKTATEQYDASQRPIAAALAQKWGHDINVFNYKKCETCKKDCPKDQIVDQEDCTKCKTCPAKQKANASQDKCIKDKKKAADEKKKSKRKEWKKRATPRKKEFQQKRYDRERDEEKRRKTRRMSRCLGLVPLAMGSGVVDEVDDLFDEEWANGMEMMPFWPEDLEAEKWENDDSDKKYEEDGYINEYINIGKNRKRSPLIVRDMSLEEKDNVPASFQRTRRDLGPVSPRTDLQVRDNHLHKRLCIPCFLIPIFAALARTAAAVARVASNIVKGAVKVAKGRNGRSKLDQKKGAEKVSKDKNWRNCLSGKSPVK